MTRALGVHGQFSKSGFLLGSFFYKGALEGALIRRTPHFSLLMIGSHSKTLLPFMQTSIFSWVLWLGIGL